ncbi:hypothetical protein D0Z70_20860 [Sphingobium terrigena]|uniref:Uncharacterized protein n=1 Tax=Sphingobium terrigena TaxID=2304063 RepID=A0A418YM82_9SPHN|nr:hypothetical protein [Sphingobium terrigena]RJG52233.1 hypothetical protein D0Z70_20860 [Sphingobium terrigena]
MFGQHRGGGGSMGGGNPTNWIIKWFSITMAVGFTFVFTPQIHGATVDWAIGYMEVNYGAWMVAIGWFFWWIIVAMLTFLFSALVVMLALMAGEFLMLTLGSGGGRR